MKQLKCECGRVKEWIRACSHMLHTKALTLN
jgi:hypothetical protein